MRCPARRSTPSSITRIRSASRIVESRCAITNDVRSVRSAAIACCSSSSVRVSTELVASSRISSAGSARNARAIVTSCRSPALKVGALLVDDGVVAVGQRVHEAVHERRPRGLEDLLLGRVRAAVGDVVADRALEQPGVLQHHARCGRAASRGGIVATSTPSRVIRPASSVVEPHHQVDQRRLAGAGRPDDRDRLARGGRPATGPRSAAGPRRSGTTRARRRPRRGRRRRARRRPARPAPRRRRAARRPARPRRRPDCSRLTIEATWVSGWVNCREYWMNACTSPSDQRAARDPEAAEHGDHDVVEVPDEHHHRHDQPGDELRAEADLEQLVVLLREDLLDLVLAAEHLDQRVAREGLLDVRVELAGAPPLRR